MFWPILVCNPTKTPWKSWVWHFKRKAYLIKKIFKKNEGGKLQAGATVANQYITFPTDAKLLNSGRKKLDQIIETLHHYDDKKLVKPRTYKRVLDTAFLSSSKKKNKEKSAHRKMKRKLLDSVNRNLNFVKPCCLE
jgi:hypothetical protein